MSKIPFLKNGGEMAELTQDFDWAASPIGSPETWPQSLRTIVSMVLMSKFPMFLWWGRELIQFYNDAYRPSLGNPGKHPTALGQPAEQCWPEIWPTIKPLIDQVVNTGEATWSENQLIPIFRNGHLEDVYWTFGYSAVLDEQAQVGGVLVVCQEMTKMVTAKKKFEDSEAKFRSIIQQAPLAICYLNGPQMHIDVANDSIFKVWGKDQSVSGKSLIDALPEIKDQGFIELLEDVYQTGLPYTGESMLVKLNRGGLLQDVYFDFVYAPVRNADYAVIGILVLAVEVTQHVLSKHKVEVSEASYRDLSQQLDQQVQHRTSQLQTLVRELKRSNENLLQFAYVASHDLQEPLRKIQAFGDLLKKHFPEDLGIGINYIERMQSAAARMSVLIDDILSYYRVPISISSTKTVFLSEIFKLVLLDLGATIQQTGASFEIGELPEIPGDASQLGQLFQNLVSNALKFRRSDVLPVIRIYSQITQSDKLADQIKTLRPATNYHEISISDNGIGFDNKHNERIFMLFQRLHGKSEYIGSGIGLSVCEKITYNHGGAITGNGMPGLGSTFRVYLPQNASMPIYR